MVSSPYTILPPTFISLVLMALALALAWVLAVRMAAVNVRGWSRMFLRDGSLFLEFVGNFVFGFECGGVDKADVW